MKVKFASMAIGVFLSAAAARGAEGDDRFTGGSYDGWGQAVLPIARVLDGSRQVVLWSESSQVFDWFAADTVLLPVTVGAWGQPQSAVANGGTLRVSVPAAWQGRFDSGEAVTLGGSAAGKVGAANYSGDGRTLLIPVTADFADGDTVTVTGLILADLPLCRAGTQRLELEFTGDSAVDAYDEKALQVNPVFWCGGPYDGWSRATSEALPFWTPKGTLLRVY